MLKREKKWLDFFAALFLFAAFRVVAMRLIATDWAEDLALVRFFILSGFLLGFVLGQSAFKRWIVFLLATVYSVIVMPWAFGLTLGGDIAWSEKLIILAERIYDSFRLFVSNRPVDDYLLFVFSAVLLFWFMSLIGGFQLGREGNPWFSLMIAGTLLVIIDIYSPEVLHRGRYSSAFMFFALLSFGRVNFLKQRNRWSELGVSVDSEAGYDHGRGMVMLGLLLVVIAWSLPAISGFFNSTTNSVLRFSDWRDRFANLTVGLNVPGYAAADISYGQELKLGTGTPLDEKELFQVQASRAHPPGTPFYWRIQSYDRYVDSEWRNSVTAEHEIEPSEWPVRELRLENRVEIDLAYTIRAASLQTLYLPGQPQYVSRPAVWVGDRPAENQVDLIAVKTGNVLRNRDTIQAVTQMNNLTVSMLRQAGEEYPEWVKQRYLNLPEDFPSSVAGLAGELANDEETVYDKVRVITSYLRNEITYEPEVPRAPQNENVIEWFLFTHKAGFCNYYATSEVLMLRSLGIPTRMVVGFAQGEEDEEKENLYHVRMNDYHAWPEVFFPEIGWVPFEPTASQPVHSLRLGLSEEFGNNTGIDLGGTPNERDLSGRDPFDDLEEDPTWNLDGEAVLPQRSLHPMWIVSGVLLVLAAAALVWWRLPPGFRPMRVLPDVLERQFQKRGFEAPGWISHWAEYGQFSPVERMFSRVSVMLRLFGERGNRGDTVAEQIAVLSKYMDEESVETAEAFQAICEKALFSPSPVEFREAREKYLKLWRNVWKTLVKRWRGV